MMAAVNSEMPQTIQEGQKGGGGGETKAERRSPKPTPPTSSYPLPEVTLAADVFPPGSVAMIPGRWRSLSEIRAPVVSLVAVHPQLRMRRTWWWMGVRPGSLWLGLEETIRSSRLR